MRVIDTDVLVVGGGAAGAMAAYEASKYGVRVCLAIKGRLQRSGSTIMAPGAIAGVGDWHVPGDSQELHFEDTVVGGAYLNDQALVKVLVEESPNCIVELEKLGSLWQREADGTTYALRIDGGHTYHRCPFLEDRTGREMMRALSGAILKRRVQVEQELMVLRLVTRNDAVVGATAFDMATSAAVVIKAGSVVLACGGAGNLYENTSNPRDITGDGFSLALEAGASLMDMEFVQFYPLGFVYPDSLRGILGALLYYSRLRNSKGERFMERYAPERLELTTRDRVARAMVLEVRNGLGGPHGGVFADMTHHPPGYLCQMQPLLCETYSKIGIDPSRDYLEVAPTCHFMMGGIQVDTDWSTAVPGLYAAGESAAGIHGANRLSQNALAEVLVSGTRAGRAAAKCARDSLRTNFVADEVLQAVEPAKRMLGRDAGVHPWDLRQKLRRLLWDKAGVFRTGDGLQQCLQQIDQMAQELDRQYTESKSTAFNRELIDGLENRFLFSVAKCVVLSALRRTESRGAHYRADYPETDNEEWLKHNVVTIGTDGQIEIGLEDVKVDRVRPGGEV